MNGVKKKSIGKGVLLKRKKHVPVAVEPPADSDDSYDSMVDNGTDEDEHDDGDGEEYHDASEPSDSGHESGAFVRAPKPSPKKVSSHQGKGSSKVAKRKLAAQTDEEAHRKRMKAIKELYKPPTVEEINRLKETENYYHSNLFRMQTQEMLKKVRVPAKVDRFVQAWVGSFNAFLQTISDGDRDLIDLKYDGINFPLELRTCKHASEVLGKERFNYVPQRTVRVVGGGGDKLHTSFGKQLVVDLKVDMPEKCFHKDDYLNLRYHYKRVHYLCTIGERLIKSKGHVRLASNVQFEPLKGDRLKPVLVMVPSDTAFAKKVQFRLHAVPIGGKFPPARFLPDRNNVRPAMIGLDTLTKPEDYERFPTPHYNNSILYDLRLAKNAELLEGMIQSDSTREAIVLLKIWARQRGFDQGRYGFDGGLITFFVAYLLHNKRIYGNMSSYQIIRLFWNQLAESSWDKEGISFEPSNRSSLPLFFRFYEVVFLDPTGALNLTANLPVDLYRRVRQESVLAIRLLDNRKINSFMPLFLASYPTYTQYDHLVLFKDAKLIVETNESFAEDHDRLDYIGNPYPLFTRLVEKLLRKGLGKRITFLVPLAGEGIPDVCTLGISINAAEAFNLVDKGPEAIDKAASDEYRKFWSDKATLRRFKDGSITESCVWAQPHHSIGQKRLIVRSIVTFLLNAHLDISQQKYAYLAAQSEVVIHPRSTKADVESHETVEERSLVVIRVFDELARMLRDLDSLPLKIHAVVGTDSVFRYTDPDPPRSTATVQNADNVEVFHCSKPVHATIQLEASAKWPEELVAIRRLKTAFYIRIADGLNSLQFKETNKLIAQARNDHLDVFFDSGAKFVFRFVIIHQREIAILREYLSENQVTRMQKDTDESIALEMQATILPRLSSVLHGLHQQYFSFGSVAAIAKRWLYSQLIDSFLWPDECTELLLAGLYLNQPLPPPFQPQTGFLRWLHYVASTDWSKEMIVVNFNDEIDGETIDALERQFTERRDSFPPLTIITPCDGEKYGLFARRAPTVPVLNRVTLLAKAAIGMIDSSIRTIDENITSFFKPSYEGYNVIIHLSKLVLVGTGVRSVSEINAENAPVEPTGQQREPVVGYDPVKLYLRELREAYHRFAVFFYDPCGGNRIAVLWRPDALEEKPFTTSNINGRMLSDAGTLLLNVNALVQDFHILGRGLVTRIDSTPLS